MMWELRHQLNFQQVPGGEVSLLGSFLWQTGQLLGSLHWVLCFHLCFTGEEHKFMKLLTIMCFIVARCLFALEFLLNFHRLCFNVIFCGRA